MSSKNSNLTRLSDEELQIKLGEIQAEICRRANLQTAAQKIQKIITGLGINYSDIHPSYFEAQKTKAKQRKKQSGGKKASIRRKVKPKYKCEDGLNFWSGRGRAPRWVTDLCSKRDITLSEFKKSTEFLVDDLVARNLSEND